MGTNQSQTRAYAAVTRPLPAMDFPSNEVLVERMTVHTASPSLEVKLALLTKMLPFDVGGTLEASGVPLNEISSMYAIANGCIKVLFSNLETMERFKAGYTNNVGGIQSKLRWLNGIQTKYVLVSRIPGNYSDEAIKNLLFGHSPPPIQSVHHERSKDRNGRLMWLTGRRFYRIPVDAFEKLDFTAVPPSIEIDTGIYALVKIEGMNDRCFHCRKTGHKYANCTERDKEDSAILQDSSSSSEEEEEKEDEPLANSQNQGVQSNDTQVVDEQSTPKITDVTQDIQQNTQQTSHQTPPTSVQVTPVAARTRQHTHNPKNPHDTTPKTWKPPSGKTPTKQILSKTKINHRVTTKKPSQQQLSDPHLLVKRNFPEHSVSPPAIWKKAPSNSFTHKFALLPKIQSRELKFLLSNERDLVLSLTPNMGLLREGERGKDFGRPYTPQYFNSDIIFAPEPVFQFWDPVEPGVSQFLHYHTYYDDDDTL